jgi:type II secretory pathway component PulF
MARPVPKPVGARQAADLYIQLAAMEEAGLSAEQSFTTLARGADRGLARAAGQAAAAARRGTAVATAGQRAGLFTPVDARLIAAACRVGSPAPIYRQLAGRHRGRAERRRRVYGRMLLPAAIFVLALFIAPLPALILGHIDAASYLNATLGSLIRITALIYVLLKLPGWLRRGPPALSAALDRLLLRLPVFGRLQVRRQTTDFLGLLALALQAGLPAFDAVELAADTVPNRVIRRSLAAARDHLERGEPMAAALAHSPYLDATAREYVSTGEVSGRLAEMLAHYTRLEGERLDLIEGEVAQWIPRLVYFAVLALLAYAIVSSGGPWRQYDVRIEFSPQRAQSTLSDEGVLLYARLD